MRSRRGRELKGGNDNPQAEAGRLDKEAEVKKLTEQKKMLQMELHALGANIKTGKKGAGEKAEMMCFYCEDRTSNHGPIHRFFFIFSSLTLSQFAFSSSTQGSHSLTFKTSCGGSSTARAS